MSEVMIQAKSLTKRYGDVTAVSNVSFEVNKGEVLGFLGPNGAGKTTTMKILTCFIAPTEGTAKVNGCDVFEDPMGVRSSLGYLAEANPLYTEMLVLEYLEWVARMRGLEGDKARKRLRTVVEETDIGGVISKEIRALSKGFRQRVGLASTLLHEPPILILDEPMSGLDPNQTVEIRELIRNIGKERTVIFSTHSMSEAEKTCDRLMIITEGKIVADDTAEGLRRAAGNKRYYATFSKGGDVDDTRAKLEALSGVSRIEEVTAMRGEIRFAIVPRKKDEDLRQDILRAAFDSGSVLLDLTGETENLERRFAELTIGDEAKSDAHDKRKRAAEMKKAADAKKVDEAEDQDEEDDEDEDDDEDENESQQDSDSDSDDEASDDEDSDDEDSEDEDSEDEDSEDEDSEDEDEKGGDK